jgi:hypothetical protein
LDGVPGLVFHKPGAANEALPEPHSIEDSQESLFPP